MTGKDDNHLPYSLENMSIPELEALLHRDFCASDGAAPDVDYIMAIAEVIQKKEQALPNYQPMDAEKAWEEFQSSCSTEEGRKNSACRFDKADENTQISKSIGSVPKKKATKIVHKRLIMAALVAVLLAITMIPVSGYANVLQMLIAYWTDDYFSFAPGSRELQENKENTAMIIPKGFEDLWNSAEKNKIQNLMIPQYIPSGFQVADTSLNEYPMTGSFEFYVFFTKDDDYIGINIIKSKEKSKSVYEKDNNNVDSYDLNGIEYYIFSNNGEHISTIYCEDIVYSFGTTLPEQELKQIIDSMCKE